jgi:hypothetical protein
MESKDTITTFSQIDTKTSADFLRKIFGFRPSPPVQNTTFPITQLPCEIIQEIVKYVPESTVNLGLTCKGYVFCVKCLRKVSIYNIVKKHGMNTAQEYAKDDILD